MTVTLPDLIARLTAASTTPATVQDYEVRAWLGDPAADETYTDDVADDLVAVWRADDSRTAEEVAAAAAEERARVARIEIMLDTVERDS
jgi:hypothetical protein